jgi:hypothetical protein
MLDHRFAQGARLAFQWTGLQVFVKIYNVLLCNFVQGFIGNRYKFLNAVADEIVTGFAVADLFNIGSKRGEDRHSCARFFVPPCTSFENAEHQMHNSKFIPDLQQFKQNRLCLWCSVGVRLVFAL